MASTELMSASIWDAPYLPVKLGDHASIQGNENGCVTLWVEGHGTTLTNEEMGLLLRVLCPGQAEVDADYDRMYAALDDARVSFDAMSRNWANVCLYWKGRVEEKKDE